MSDLLKLKQTRGWLWGGGGYVTENSNLYRITGW